MKFNKGNAKRGVFPRLKIWPGDLTDTIDFNKYDINIFINDTGDFSKLTGDLNYAVDQRESEVNLHKATSSP
jgi:hypothetical protein